jgi:hypothetical protein
MDYVLPILISAFVAVVLFRRQINAASRKWFEGETTTQKETLADIARRVVTENCLRAEASCQSWLHRRGVGGGGVC